MSDDKKKDVIEVKGLGEVTLLRKPSKDKDGNEVAGVYTMTNSALEKFYADHGVPEFKKVSGAIEDAKKALADASFTFLKKQAIADKADWELRIGTGNNRCIANIDAVKQVRNVQTGEVTTKYGVCSFTSKQKTPINDELCAKIAADMEAAFKK